MKVCVFFEGGSALKKSGVGVAARRHIKALESAGIEVTTNPKEDYDVLHIHTIFPKTLVEAKRAKKRGIPVVMHAHTLEEDSKDSFFGSTTFSPFFRYYLKQVYSQADYIVTPTEFSRNALLKGYGIDCPVLALTNGVPESDFEVDPKLGEDLREELGLSGVVVFSVGHVFKRKGVDTFVETARHFDNDFVWFGNIAKAVTKDKNMKRALSNPPPNVKFTGFVPDIHAAYSAGDIFFFPTRTETQGLVILEAWAAGKAVVVRDLPVFEGWMESGKNCIKVQDEKDFIPVLKELIRDESLRSSLGASGKAELKNHSLESVGLKLKETYGGILNA